MTCFPDFGIPKVPEFEAARLLPHQVITVYGISWVTIARQVFVISLAKVANAVLEIAHAVAGPAVGEDAANVVHLHDLAGDIRHEVKVVWAQRAREPHAGIVRVWPLLAVDIDGDPIWM